MRCVLFDDYISNCPKLELGLVRTQSCVGETPKTIRVLEAFGQFEPKILKVDIVVITSSGSFPCSSKILLSSARFSFFGKRCFKK